MSFSSNLRLKQGFLLLLCLVFQTVTLLYAQITTIDADQIAKIPTASVKDLLKLLPNNNFGTSVAVSGNNIVVGTPGNDVDENGDNFLEDAGAAFFLWLTDKGELENVQKVVPAHREAGAYFGGAVSISGNRAVIGADGRTYTPEVGDLVPHAGAFYVFERDEFGMWHEMDECFANDPSSHSYFGYSLVLDGNSILAGAPGDSYDENGENEMTSAGSLYAFEFWQGAWVQNQKLVAPDREPYASFAYSVDMSAIAGRAIVGAPYASTDKVGTNALDYSGKAYTYDWDPDAAFAVLKDAGWVPDGDKSVYDAGDDRSADDYFGWDVSIAANLFGIGSPGEDVDASGEHFVESAGASYVWYDSNGDGIDDGFIKLVANDREEYNYYGNSTEIVNTQQIRRPLSLFDDPLPFDMNLYGFQIGAQGNYYNDIGQDIQPGAGAIYEHGLYLPVIVKQKAIDLKEDVTGKADTIPGPLYSIKITPPDRAAGDNFGVSIAGEKNIIIAGANGTDFIDGSDTLFNTGSIYLIDMCPKSFVTISAELCDSFVSPSGKYVWTEEGNYIDTLLSSMGCDSIVTIELERIDTDLSISKNESSLEVGESDAEYQWLDCDNNFSPVTGATDKSFSPSESGNYAVAVTKGDCTDTSACTTFTVEVEVGTTKITGNLQPFIFPNPGSGSYILDLGASHSVVDLEIMNNLGQVVLRRTYRDDEIIDFNVEGSAGVYSVFIRTDSDKQFILQLLKE